MGTSYGVTPQNTLRSYVIKTETGAVYRRNRRHLRETGEVFPLFQHQSADEPVDDEPDVPPPTPHQTVDFASLPSPTSVTTPLRRSTRVIKKPVILDL